MVCVLVRRELGFRLSGVGDWERTPSQCVAASCRERLTLSCQSRSVVACNYDSACVFWFNVFLEKFGHDLVLADELSFQTIDFAVWCRFETLIPRRSFNGLFGLVEHLSSPTDEAGWAGFPTRRAGQKPASCRSSFDARGLPTNPERNACVCCSWMILGWSAAKAVDRDFQLQGSQDSAILPIYRPCPGPTL